MPKLKIDNKTESNKDKKITGSKKNQYQTLFLYHKVEGAA